MSETAEAPAPERRGLGSCGVPIPADNGTTSTVIGPDGALRECCDGDGLGGVLPGGVAGGEVRPGWLGSSPGCGRGEPSGCAPARASTGATAGAIRAPGFATPPGAARSGRIDTATNGLAEGSPSPR